MSGPAHLPPIEARPEVAGTQTLDRAMQILRLVASCGSDGATFAVLRQGTKLSRATLYRLLAGLRQQGMLRQPTGRGPWFLGYELLSMGAQAGNESGLRELARPALLQLAVSFGDSFFLLVPDGYFALCLEMQDGERPVRCFSQAVGGRILMGVGQASIALMAAMPREQREHVLQHNAPRLAREYHLEISSIRRRIRQAARQGYAISAGGIGLEGYTGVAVSIPTRDGISPGALSCATATSSMTRQHRRALIEALRQHADSIGARAGHLRRLE